MIEQSYIPTLLMKVQITLNVMRAARVRYEDQLAPDFGVFDFIEPDENKLSSLLAWLLDAQASHGQGSSFLKAFVRQFKIPWDEKDCFGATATTEVSTDRLVAWNRRIDILVRSNARPKAIGIENKPWAADQQGQMADYLRHLAANFPGEHCLLYISGDGSDPSDASIGTDEKSAAISDRRLVIITYMMLMPWLLECRAICRADRVTYFLSEFLRFIKKNFAGVRDVSERQEVIRQITSTPEALTAALQIVAAGEDLKQHMLGVLNKQLAKEASIRQWQYTSHLNERTPRFCISFRASESYCFCLEASTSSFRDTYYGITVTQAETEEGKRLIQRVGDLLTSRFGRGRQGGPWAWWRYASALIDEGNILPLEKDWSANEAPWLQIMNGELAQIIIIAAQKMEAVLHADAA